MIKHLLAYAPAKIIPGIISFFSIFIFARIFTTKEYGNYTYILSIITLIIAVIFSWIRLSSFRFFNIYSEEMGKSRYLSFVFSITIWLAVISLFLLVLTKLIFLSLVDKIIVYAVIAGILTVFYDQILSINRAELLSNEFKKYSILSPVIKLFTTLFFVFIIGIREESIFFATIISCLIIISIYLHKLKETDRVHLQIINPLDNKLITKKFLTYGLPLTSSILFSIIIASSDRILINRFLDESAVAIYSLSYDTSSFIIGNIFMILNFTFIPTIMKSIDSNNNLLANKNIHNYFWMIIFVLVPISYFLYFFSPYIAKYVLGDRYYTDDTITIIKLMGFGAFLSGVKAYFFDFAFQFGKKTHIQIIPIALGAITNVLLNIWWLPILGLVGALYATLASYFIALISSIFLGRKAFPMTIDKKDTINIIVQLILLFILYSILIKVNIRIWGLIYNISIFGSVWIIYFVINYRKVKKILR